jgi:hypothetical protein
MNKERTKLSVAGVYDGYQFIDVDASGGLIKDSLKFYTGHSSICYACEYLDDSKILTSSFYDNTLHLIKHN